MKALIERGLYHPTIGLAVLTLTGLMVTLDFNIAKIALVVVAKGSQYAFHSIFGHRGTNADDPPQHCCDC
jgi:hypothetical protein